MGWSNKNGHRDVGEIKMRWIGDSREWMIKGGKGSVRRGKRKGKKCMRELVAESVHVILMIERSPPLYVIEKGGEYEDSAVDTVGLLRMWNRVVCICPVSRIPQGECPVFRDV